MPSGVYPRTSEKCLAQAKKKSEELKWRKIALGNKWSEEAKLASRKARKGNWTSEKNPRWNDSQTYVGIHKWLRSNYGQAKDFPCMICKGTLNGGRIEWANLDGKYSKDTQTWTTMCVRCHRAFDAEARRANNKLISQS